MKIYIEKNELSKLYIEQRLSSIDIAVQRVVRTNRTLAMRTRDHGAQGIDDEASELLSQTAYRPGVDSERT